MARRQSSFCSNFRAVSLSFSRFMRLERRWGTQGIRGLAVERYRDGCGGGKNPAAAGSRPGSSSPPATARASRSRSGAGGRSASSGAHRRGEPPEPPVERLHARPRPERLEELEALGRAEQLRRDHPLGVGQDPLRLLGGRHAHGTKSSWLASVGIEPMLAGMASVRDSATSDAAEICTIMKPDESPGSAVRKAGSPWERSGFTSRSTRRSAIAWSVVSAIARKSSAWATGWPWKLPPEITSPSGNTSGLSVEALSSTVDRVRGRSGSRRPPRRAPAARSGGE